MINTAPIEVPHTPELMAALSALIARPDGPEVVIETGTYKGTGTTMALIKALKDTTVPGIYDLDIHTLEANSEFFWEAKNNLAAWPFVHPQQALSLPRTAAINFMCNDPVINGMNRPYGIVYDVNPMIQLQFYIQEISPPRVPLNIEQDALPKLAQQFNDQGKKILFVLDSAGGLGWLEFQTTIDIMQKRAFFLWLDDCNHVKHYRSKRVIDRNEDGRWKVLFSDERGLIAERTGA